MLKEYSYFYYTECVTRTFVKSGCNSLLQSDANHALLVSRPQLKTSSGGPESLRDTRNTSGVSTLPHRKAEYTSTVENVYSKRLYQNSMGGNVAMEMVPASKGDWGQSVGGLQQASFVDSDEEHIYDDIINVY